MNAKNIKMNKNLTDAMQNKKISLFSEVQLEKFWF